jgi:hypothetical protein
MVAFVKQRKKVEVNKGKRVEESVREETPPLD